MDDHESHSDGDEVAAVVRALCRHDNLWTYPNAFWFSVVPKGFALPQHGWKLHVSARPTTYPALVSRLVPLLLNEGCAFKFAHSVSALAELNDGSIAPAAVGKAFTIYPAQERFRSLGTDLVDLLRDEPGPRVLSDRRIDESAPVYYRYGRFTASTRPYDRIEILTGPNGEQFDLDATLECRQPAWLPDPFLEDSQPRPQAILLGGHYQVRRGILRAARGNVYRAIDERTGATVIVKQARAFVGETAGDVDVRTRIRNERRVLEAADGIEGVPRFLDHFRHADDEFLVMTDQGPITLAGDIRRKDRYRPVDDRRSLTALGRRLAKILIALHSRDIVVCDLAPKNIVLDSDAVSIVDFGVAAYAGSGLPGHTPGYSSPRRARGEPPRDTDDIYALGMTLLEAATGLPPVAPGDDLELPARRALETVHAMYGDSPGGIVELVVDLLSEHDHTARSALQRLADGQRRVSGSRRWPAVAPVVTPTYTGHLTAQVLDALLTRVDSLLDVAAGPDGLWTGRNPSLFNGYADVGLELLHHRTAPGVADRLERLVAFTRGVLDAEDVPAGLFTGRTGADLFVRTASGVDADQCAPGKDRDSARLDVFEGAAGVGLTHLWLYQRDGDARDLAVARHCADRASGWTGPNSGLAHGRAGITELGLALADTTSERLPSLASNVSLLAAETRALVARAADPAARPVEIVSWCNGLAGMARVLLHAGRTLDRPDLVQEAVGAAESCAGWVRRLAVLGQCCGAAGVGDLLVDVALDSGSQRHWDAATDVVRQLLLRSGGTTETPVFVPLDPAPEHASWKSGLAGLLGFLRRLRDTGGSRILPGI